MAFLAIGMVGIVGHAKESTQKVILSVTENGFEPKSIDVKPGTNVVLEVTRKTDSTCANQIQVPSKKIKVELPRDKMVSIALGKLEKGEIRFGCGMNMMEAGRIIAR
jgi:plastocyanin domain-containing protein